jgi:hypothetical protein
MGFFGAGKTKKKGRKSKTNSGLMAWVAFVKKVQKEEKLTYKDAMHRAKQRKDKGEKWMKHTGTKILKDVNLMGGSNEFKEEEPEEKEPEEEPKEKEPKEKEEHYYGGYSSGGRRGHSSRRRGHSSRRRGHSSRRRGHSSRRR